MYRTERQPAWQRDVTWASAVLLALTLLVGTLLFSLSRLSSPSRGPEVVNDVLRLTLRPGGEGSVVDVRTSAGYRPGEALMLLPGLEVYADPSEVATFTADAAVSRSAGVLTDRLVTGGREALLATATGAPLRRQIELALAGPVPQLVSAAIGAEMLPAGLDDGSRLADWPAQAAAKPGEPVQPLVGVFVTFPVNQVQGMTNREIGAAVVEALAARVLNAGLGDALALVTNDNLRARLQRGADTVARAQLHELFSALLTGQRAEMEARLVEAQAVASATDAEPDGLSGLLPASQLAGLTAEQADERVLEALAERAYQGGGELAAAQLTRTEQVERVRGVAPLIDTFAAQAHGRYLTWTWLVGILALMLTVLLAGFSKGLLRLVNVGVAVAIGAGLGALLFQRLGAALPDTAALPLGASAQGLFGALGGMLAYAAAQLPADLLALPLRNYLIVAGFGAALVVLALLLALLRGVRPRRRFR